MADLRTIQGSPRWATLAASDTVNLAEIPRSIHVSVSGTATLVDSTGNAVAFGTLAVGPYPYQPTRVNSTGTTATIIGLY